ncbi:MAG: hypothetical protein ABI390_11500 [Daejeonella sp.]
MNKENSKESFSKYISDPASVQDSGKENIENLLSDFPYCQLLHAFRAKISKDTNENDFNDLLAKASVYSPDRKILYSIINKPEFFKAVIEPMSPDELDIEISQSSSHPHVDETEIEYTEIIEETTEPIHSEEAVLVSENIETDDHIETSAEASPQKNQIDPEEKILLENIASADFFAFEKKLSDHTNKTEKTETDTLPADEISEVTTEERKEVSRYDDDQMPYSFLWWLHKTRKEHADTYQPYIKLKFDNSQTPQKENNAALDQQIKENIFHLQSPLDNIQKPIQKKTVHFELRRKEEAIIEKFIREEPQIKPPAPDKLDNENKARRSSVYPNDLVSETLAAIYTEQMLFHKAIDTYNKLSLKFPEKSAYFADQIRLLEKKIN